MPVGALSSLIQDRFLARVCVRDVWSHCRGLGYVYIYRYIDAYKGVYIYVYIFMCRYRYRDIEIYRCTLISGYLGI